MTGVVLPWNPPFVVGGESGNDLSYRFGNFRLGKQLSASSGRCERSSRDAPKELALT